MNAAPTPEQVEADTLAWLDKAVIGLNLCPFAISTSTWMPICPPC